MAMCKRLTKQLSVRPRWTCDSKRRDLKHRTFDSVKAADLVVGRPYFRVGSHRPGHGSSQTWRRSYSSGATCIRTGLGWTTRTRRPSFRVSGSHTAELEPFPKADAAGHDHFTFEMNDKWFDVYPEREDAGVLDFDRALESLMHCSHASSGMGRRVTPHPTASAED